jgi:uncharacterized protein YcfL
MRIARAFQSTHAVVYCIASLAAILILACSSDPSSPDRAPSSVRFARSTSDVVVSSTAPDSATQDTTVDVTIGGSGFTSDMVATWALAGVSDPTQVRTNSTRYVNSRTLVANITISATATTGSWDVQVSSKSKGGIGTELFTVKTRHVSTDTKPSVVWMDSVNVAPSNQTPAWEAALITGDYRDRTGSPLTGRGVSGEYYFNFCGVDGYMQSNTTSYPQAALNMDADHLYSASTMDGPCGGSRYYQFFFSGRASAPLRFAPQHYVLKIGDLAVGQSLIEEVHFGIQQTNCSTLRFDDAYPPASNALVVRLADSVVAGVVSRRWHVQSQGTHRAMCTIFTNKGPKPTGVTYYLPFAFVIAELYQPFAKFP